MSSIVIDKPTVSALKQTLRNGKVTVYVRSKKMVVASRIVTFPAVYSGLGLSSPSGVKHVAFYENVLDDEQETLVRNSIALANSLGVHVEVKDVAKFGRFTRFLAMVLGERLPSRTPSMSFEGDAIALIRDKPDYDTGENRKEECEIPA